MADVVVRFRGNADSLEEALEVVRDSASEAGVEVERLNKKVRATGKAGEKTGKTVNRNAEQLEGLKQAAQAAGGRVGEMAGRVEAAGRAATALLNPVTASVAAVGLLSVASAAAGVAIGAAFVKIVRGADQARQELDDLGVTGLGLDEADAAAVRSSAAALDAVAATAKQLGAEIGAELAPTVKGVARVLVALGLAAVDGFNSLIEGTNRATRGLNLLVEFGIMPFRAAALAGAIAAVELGQALGLNTERAEEAVATLESYTVAGLASWAATELMTGELAEYSNRADALIDALDRKKEAEEQDKAAIDALRKSQEQLSAMTDAAVMATLEGEDLILFKRNQQIARLREVAAAAGDADLRTAESRIALAAIEEQYSNEIRDLELSNAEEVRQKFKAIHDEEMRQQEEARRAAEEAARQRIASANAIAGAVSGLSSVVQGALQEQVRLYEEGGEVSEKAAKRAFVAQKALAIGDVALKTAMGVMNAFATLPTAAAIPAAAAIGATGAVQAGIIAATQFGSGGGSAPSGPSSGGGAGGGLTSAAISGPKPGTAEMDGTTLRRVASTGGTMYRHRDLDVVAADGYPGSAFDGGIGYTGQRRQRVA